MTLRQGPSVEASKLLTGYRGPKTHPRERGHRIPWPGHGGAGILIFNGGASLDCKMACGNTWPSPWRGYTASRWLPAFLTLSRSQRSPLPLRRLLCGSLGGGSGPRTRSPGCVLDMPCYLRTSPCPLWASPPWTLPAWPAPLLKGCQKLGLPPPAPPRHFNLGLTRDFNRQRFSREFIKTCKHGWGYKILSSKAVKHASVCCVNWIFMSWLFKLQFTTVAGPEDRKSVV